jgi:hypothetical protein
MILKYNFTHITYNKNHITFNVYVQMFILLFGSHDFPQLSVNKVDKLIANFTQQ